MTASGTSLERWGDALVRHAAAKIPRAISATSLVKERAGFGQTVRPAPGSVLASAASTQLDYFFHWLRDSALVIDATRVFIRRGLDADAWMSRYHDFVRFSLGLNAIDGRALVAAGGFRERAQADHLKYIRPDEELSAVHGARVPGDVRFNADGTIDYFDWHRPQNDGPALRALTCLRFADDGIGSAAADALIRGDLAYTARNAGAPCYDIWEEDWAQHYNTVIAQYAALRHGARWAEERGEAAFAAELAARRDELADLLDRYWDESGGLLRSRLPGGEKADEKALDFSLILGVVHAGLESGPHSVADPRVRTTFLWQQAMFRDTYAINAGRASGIMFGRYKGDTYISGGAWYISTFAAAEYHYRLAVAVPNESEEHIASGDAILARVRNFIPASGDLSEQFDQTTGEQTSAEDLTWSYAGFVTAWAAREAALSQAGARS